MRNKFFYIFRSLAKIFSGSGLRAKYPLLNSLYRNINRSLSPESVIIFGHKMFLDHDDSLGLTLHGIYEPKETQLIMSLVKPGQIAVDIGANIGYFTLILAQLVEEHGRVIAFEPDPTSFRILQRNISSNGFRNVVLESKAVSNRTGNIYLQLDKFNNLDHRISTKPISSSDLKVRTVCLDEYFRDFEYPIDFIKMDVQGAERLVLQGMRKLIGRSKSLKILTEFWPTGLNKFGGAASYLHELESLGFSLFDIGSGTESDFIRRSCFELLEAYPSTSTEYTNLLCIYEDHR